MRTITLSIALLILLAAFQNAVAGDAGKYTPRSSTPEELKGYVERGAQYILDKGEETAFADLTDAGGPWVDGDWYLYINNFEGYIVAHLNKKLVGKTLMHIRDVKGNAFYAEMQAIAQGSAGRGWVKFWWPRPGSLRASPKLGFIMRIPGKELWIGTGLYDPPDEFTNRVLGNRSELIDGIGQGGDSSLDIHTDRVK